MTVTMKIDEHINAAHIRADMMIVDSGKKRFAPKNAAPEKHAAMTQKMPMRHPARRMCVAELNNIHWMRDCSSIILPICRTTIHDYS